MSDSLEYLQFNSQVEQYVWITEKILELSKNGQNLSEVAVISRKHSSLVELSKYLLAVGLPLYYERGQNILNKPYIHQLLTILKFVHSLAQKETLEADELLPEILAYPFWQICRQDLWLISIFSYSQKDNDAKLWLDVMQKADQVEVAGQKLVNSDKFKQIANFLICLAVEAKYTPIERLIDRVVGSYEVGLSAVEATTVSGLSSVEATTVSPELSTSATFVPPNPLNSGERLESTPQPYSQGEESPQPSLLKRGSEIPLWGGLATQNIVGNLTAITEPLYKRQMEDSVEYLGTASQFQTNFKQYYFDNRLDLNNKQVTTESLHFLSNLRTLISSIRQYRTGETIYLLDLVEYLNLLEKNKIPLIDNSPFGSQERAVNLLTAHKAKGLEFEIVFVVDCLQEEWFGKRHSLKLGLPINLPFLPDSDDGDDQLRLLYVAITRAKYHLYFSTYIKAVDSKKTSSISLLETALDAFENGVLCSPEFNSESKTFKALNLDYISQLNIDFSDSERILLVGLLKDYKLSVTHLNNYLDVSKGGPRRFFEQNLLQFPKSKNVSLVYGTAMHEAIRSFLQEYKSKNSYPAPSYIIGSFFNRLSLGRLTKKEFDEFFEIGSENLVTYYNYKKDKIAENYKLEFSFASQEVCLNQARITGQIDLIEFLSDNSLLVTDFKTGKPLDRWKDSNNQTKLWGYQNQLIFYKILVENSRFFGGKYSVQMGQLEFLDAHYLSRNEISCLQKSILPEEVATLSRLIEIVYQKIINLDFPNTDNYTSDFKGIEKFIADLLAGTI